MFLLFYSKQNRNIDILMSFEEKIKKHKLLDLLYINVNKISLDS
jgi:hypothetical protein